MLHFFRVFGLIGLALSLMSAPAAAGFIGNTVGIYERVDSPFAFPPGPADTLVSSGVVGSQIELDASYDFIDLGDDTITIGNNDRNCVGASCPILFLGSGDFLGFKITDIADELEPILNVSVLSSTSGSFSNADISFSDNEIFIRIEDFGGYRGGSVVPFSEVILQVTFAEQAVQVSAPSGQFAFIASLLAIAMVRRRRT